MRDGFNIAKRGIPSVAMITDDFWEQGEFMAKSLGMSDLPRVRLPHPVAGLGEVKIDAIAQRVVDEILEKLANE